MIKNIRKTHKIFLSFFTVGMLLFGSLSFVFGESGEADLVKEYTFSTTDRENPKYDCPQKIKEKGRTYKLINTRYEIVRDNKVHVTKKVTTADKNNFTKEIRHKLPSGKTIKLYADPGKIKWKEENASAVTAINEYKTEAEIPESIPSYKTDEEGNRIDIVLRLADVRQMSRTEKFSAPAKFYSSQKDGTRFYFNDKMVVISNGEPRWYNYKEDVKAYLGLNGNEYAITGGAWSGAYQKTDSGYVRKATFTGTKVVPYYNATYTETGDTTVIYTADITYTGTDIDMPITAKAICEYQKSFDIKKVIAVSACILIIAFAAVAILFVIAKRKKTIQYRK